MLREIQRTMDHRGARSHSQLAGKKVCKKMSDVMSGINLEEWVGFRQAERVHGWLNPCSNREPGKARVLLDNV